MYELERKKTHCLECGDPIPYGRSDRKYCSESCKNRYHNRETRRWRGRYTQVINVLTRNHGILERLIHIGVESIPKSELAQMGYNFDFVTSCRRVGRRVECRCFDIRFFDTDSRIMKLERTCFPWDAEPL
jgi:predicted nucleic acid-binding Zn ribbon protein